MSGANVFSQIIQNTWSISPYYKPREEHCHVMVIVISPVSHTMFGFGRRENKQIITVLPRRGRRNARNQKPPGSESPSKREMSNTNIA